MSASSEISVYDRMCWPSEQIERSLARGSHRRELLAFFGRRDYELLRALALEAERNAPRQPRARIRGGASRGTRRVRARPTIYLLPGMLGSQLGWPRTPDEPPDLLWLDPADVIRGRLSSMRWRRRDRCDDAVGDGRAAAGFSADYSVDALRPLGVIPYIYLALKLRLAAFGFDVVAHDYDWRCDLSLLARALARRLEADAAKQIVLVGHSMGGLLACAALKECSQAVARRVVRVIGIGTPFAGAIGAAQVLRATYPVLLRLAALDPRHGPETLSATFRNFASLYQMLPAAAPGVPDLFDPASWPRRGPRPRSALLAAARGYRQTLAPADERFVSIVGTGQRTATGIELHAGQFRYEISSAGDGTVPAAHATLPGASNYSLRCEHSELPRHARVAAAIAELLLQGHTRQLRSGVNARKGRCAYVTDVTLQRVLGAKLDWHALSAAARRCYLNALNAPPASYRPSR